MSSSLTPVITDAGITALIDARNNGLTARITEVAVGDGGGTGSPYTASADMTALRNEIQRVVVSGGERIGNLQNQLHLTATVQDDGNNVPDVYPIYEIGFFLDTGELFAVYASPAEKLAEKVIGTDFLLAFDLTFTGADAGSIVVNGSGQLQTPAARDNILLGLNTVKIHTQAEFDRVFNQGVDTLIPANMTITLSPIQGVSNDIADGAAGGTGDNPENTFNGRPAYILKNSIVLSENVNIIGFNQEDTVVVKDAADTQIKLQGSNGAPVTGIRLHGWSFDGRGGINSLGGNLVGSGDGGAFYLDYCEQCDLDCKIVNHQTNADGGGIFGANNVRYITATQVHHNRAVNGGGAANCHSSTLNVYDCSATASGSGTFNCDNAMLRLFNCQASQGNGVFVNDNSDLAVSGNVGIGTAALGNSSLSVKPASTAAGARMTTWIASNGAQDGLSMYIQQPPDSTDINSPFVFSTSNAYRFRVDDIVALEITDDRNVGIGTNNPTAKLDVNGDAHVSSHLAVDGNLSFGNSTRQMVNLWGTVYAIGVQSSTHYFRTDQHFAWYRRGSHSTSALDAGSGGSVQMVLDSSGNLGIDTTSPSEKLHVNGVTRTGGIRFDDSVSAHIDTDGSMYRFGGQAYLTVDDNFFIRDSVSGTRFHFDTNNARLGIGTANPRATLDVHGDINIDGTKPFLIRKYTNVQFGFNTGVNASIYSAAIIGFHSSSGDIQESGSGTIIQMFMQKTGGTWRITADFRSHNVHEVWTVWVMFINQNLVDESGF